MAHNKDGWEVVEGRIDRTKSPPRVSRAAKKAVNGRAEAIVELLRNCSVADLAQLPISDEVRRGLANVAGLKKNARNRQLKSLNHMIRESDVEALEQALAGGTPGEQRAQEMDHWRHRILREGDTAIEAFVSAFPDADRQQIRTLTRRASKAGEGSKPYKQLFRLLLRS